MKTKLDQLQVPDSGPDSAPFDWTAARRVQFANLKPSTETISLRLPLSMLAELKQQANRRDMPYQSYIKALLFDGIKRNGLET